MDWISQPDAWIGLLSLVLLEVVLGIDNLVFISILSGKLPVSERGKAQKLGLMFAVVTRILFLMSISWIMALAKNPLFNVAGKDFTGKDLILIAGGAFLIGKAVYEIHGKLEGEEHGQASGTKTSIQAVILQILAVDVVFSVDSVITAVGMVKYVPVMVIAVLIATGVMITFVTPLSRFVEKHPTIKMLALSFLILIGFNLVVEGLHYHVDKAITYVAMAFALGVELLNIRIRSKAEPVQLKHNYPVDPDESTTNVIPMDEVVR